MFLLKQKALIIGGSKGLGEATVKILSLGSARILFSYFRGKKDAHQHRKAFKKNIKIFYLNIEKKINLNTLKNIQYEPKIRNYCNILALKSKIDPTQFKNT